MQTLIHSRDFALTTALYDFIQLQAKKSMRVCSDQVERLVIRLKDINGPNKGGSDKECCVEVKLPHCPPFVVSKRNSDAYLSITEALTGAAKTTQRRIGKRRTRKHNLRLMHSTPIGTQEDDSQS